MYVYILRRLLATIPIMALVAVFLFMLLHLSPGDPAVIIAGDFASEDQVHKIREALGLNDPLYVQFGRWMINLLQGDMGQSIYSGMPVTKLIGQRVEPTLMLTLCTMVIAISLAIPLGVIAAWKVGTWIDRVVMTLAVFGFSVPVFVIGYLLILGGIAHARLVSGAGLYKHLRKHPRLPVAYHPSRADPRRGLHGVDCKDDTRHHAGSSQRGLCAHRLCQGSGHAHGSGQARA